MSANKRSQPPDERISETEMHEALGRSGYLLEARVHQRFRRAGFSVDANMGYVDPISKKTREMDLKAQIGLGRPGRAAAISVVGECRNNRQPVVFMVAKPEPVSKGHRQLWVGTPPMHTPRGRGEVAALLAEAAKAHHYNRASLIATQFCTFEWKRNDPITGISCWMATHPQDDEGIFPKLAAASSYYLSQRSDLVSRLPHPWIEILNPLLVIQGDLWLCTQEDDGQHNLQRADRLLYRVSVNDSEGNIENMYVDVVTEASLEAHLDLLKQDYGALVTHVEAHTQKLQEMLNDSVGSVG